MAAADYLAVAPTVVAVARDIELPPLDARLRPSDDELPETVEWLRRAVRSRRVDDARPRRAGSAG